MVFCCMRRAHTHRRTQSYAASAVVNCSERLADLGIAPATSACNKLLTVSTTATLPASRALRAARRRLQKEAEKAKGNALLRLAFFAQSTQLNGEQVEGSLSDFPRSHRSAETKRTRRSEGREMLVAARSDEAIRIVSENELIFHI